MNILGQNQTFPIFNANGTSFNGLVLHKPTYSSVVMSLADRITGDVYYIDNTLSVTMQEYIEYKNNPNDPNEELVRFVLVNPPTIVREGLVSDNGDLHGMTKYSFEFYHPMCMLSNFPFTDVAVTESEEAYLSESKTFSWIGRLADFVDKLNANLASTKWIVDIDDVQLSEEQRQKIEELSEVLTFDNNSIADALKTGYDTWKVPFVISSITSGNAYNAGKRFLITFGLPSQEIIGTNGRPFVFRFGQGVGLKNNSRTPKNNKIVTRISGYGSETNIPYGYPQIIWTGNQNWDYTINNQSGMQSITIGGVTIQAMSYPIYDGIVGGEKVRLIKHPFTRNHLMPSVYVERVNKKVNPLASGYNPNITLIDYYDAPNGYPNPIVNDAPSVEVHGFDEIKPELGEEYIVGASPEQGKEVPSYIRYSELSVFIHDLAVSTKIYKEQQALYHLEGCIRAGIPTNYSVIGGSYSYSWKYTSDENFYYIKYTSDNINFEQTVLKSGRVEPTFNWDDSIDDEGNPKQGYFQIKLPILSFDLYASAAITQEMKINMRSGACIGCTFEVAIDWDDYRKNFYGSDGSFSPVDYRDFEKYPDSTEGEITIIVQKDINTFGTLMPNIYQQPGAGDKFVILGISLPLSYITNAQTRLDSAMMEYMLENNVHYYEYPLKISEHFLAQNTNILLQLKNNSIVRFEYAGVQNALYIKEISIKWGEAVLPQYNVTLTDDVEIVLNKIGQVTDDVSRVRVQINEMQKYYGQDLSELINSKISRISDDVAQGRITFQEGLNALASVVLSDEIRSSNYETGMYTGKGWRIDNIGNAEMESIRVRSFLQVVELLVNRLQAQEGDTLYSDNDQIQMVEEIDVEGDMYYRLSLKEKWSGYITAQKAGNIIKGIVNTLAAKDGQVSDVDDGDEGTQSDGDNSYYTSWMIMVEPPSGVVVGTNQIVVTLCGDNETPAGKNFKPCELMTIARWGCLDAPSGATEAEKADVERRQRSFYISTTDGRITKMRGVNSPVLRNSNYGTTLGILPDFVRRWSIGSRLIDGRDYLYAQGIVVGDFIKVDYQGDPIINYVDKGQWANNTRYLAHEYNEQNLQWETHEVWHNGAKWRCRRSQPVSVGGIERYYEPSETNSLFWDKLFEASGVAELSPTNNITIECDNTGGVSAEISGNITSNVRRGDFLIQGVKIYSVDGIDYHDAAAGCLDLCEVASSGISIRWTIGSNEFEYYISRSAHISSHDFAIVLCDAQETEFYPTTFSVIASKKGERGIQGIQGIPGEQGERGKIGRNFIYGGLWSDFTASDVFVVTDAEAPYFALPKSGNPNEYNYWVWVGENGSYAFNSENMPSNSNENWQLMTTDFKYLISEGMFTDFAKLGSAVFNKDWMYSQYAQSPQTILLNGATSINISQMGQCASIAFPVVMGDSYTLTITAKASSGTLYFRPGYMREGAYQQGRNGVNTNSTSYVTLSLPFVAERTGMACLMALGTGYVSYVTIDHALSSAYQTFSPDFARKNPVVLYKNGDGQTVNGSRTRNGQYIPYTNGTIFLIAGKQYTLTVTARCTNSPSAIAVFDSAGSKISASELTSWTSANTTQTATFYATVSGEHTIRFNNDDSSTPGKFFFADFISITAIDPFIPEVAVDWLSGYAHFGGDTTRFNGDGSGILASGGFSWDAQGNTFSRGFNRRAVLNVNQGNYDSFVIEKNNWGVLELSRMGQWINFTYNKVTGTAPTVQIILPATWTLNLYADLFTQQYCRSFVGSKILIYNNAALPMTVASVGQVKDCTFANVDLQVGQFCELECKMGVDNSNNEDVYWSLNIQGNIKN